MPNPSGSHRGCSTRVALFALLAVALLLVPAGLVAASGPNGTIRGYIRDAASLRPIANATVRVTAADVTWVFQVTTNAAGYYVVSVPNHSYTVLVSSPAYSLNSTTLVVGSGLAIWNNMTLNLAAARTATLQGYVTDSLTTAPVTAGRIVVTGAPWLSPSEYTNASALNASGFYAMHLVPAPYSLTTDGVQNYSLYAYAYLYLNGPGVRWFNISLTPNPRTSWVNGTVQDATTYARVAGANVTATVDGASLPSVLTNATGAFSLRTSTGTIRMTGDAPGYAPNTATAYLFSVGTTTVTISLTPLSVGLHGSVRDGVTGAPLSSILVTATPIFSNGYTDEALSNATGHYALALPPDDYYLRAAATGYAPWFSSAYLTSVQELNITLWPIASTVQGYLIDGGTGLPVPGLSLYAYDQRSGYAASAVSDGAGFYSVLLPPGPGITLRVLSAAPYAGTYAYLNAKAYGTTWANLTLDRLSAAIAATVTDAQTGLPISNAYVTVYWGYGSNTGSTGVTGGVTVGVPQGVVLTLYANAVGYFGWSAAQPGITGSFALSIELNPAITANVTIRGIVRDAGTRANLVFAFVQVSGYNGSAPWAYTDGTGNFTLNVVPRPQTVRVTAYGYAAGVAAINPAPNSTIWVNFSLARDAVAPLIVNFTATPSANLGPGNPTSLRASINETSFQRATLSILMMTSLAGTLGTFLNLGSLDASALSATPAAPGNTTVASTWNTRTPVTRLSDGATSEWWPVLSTGYPFEIGVTGYWNNATLSGPTPGTAYFDGRTGALLYVWTPYGFIAPQDQPTSTFTPYAFGQQINLANAAIVGTILVTGSTFQLGSLQALVAPAVPGGTYAALLEAWDAAGNYAHAAVVLQVVADTIPPVARAGPNQVVDQRATVTFNGTASTDNTGIVNYTWSFTDGSLRHLYGAIARYAFAGAGAYTVTLLVRDAAGNTGTGALTVTVRDVTPPTVTIVMPADGANVSGSVPITVTASDNVAVVRIEFFADGVRVGNVSLAPFPFTLDTRTLANGNHTIAAIAYDAAGNSATATRHVFVDNAASGNGPLGLSTVVWGVLAAVVLAGVLGLLFIVFRRKKPREQLPPPPPPPPPTPPS